MIKKIMVIQLRDGLQARSVTNFVCEANRFVSEIFIEKDSKKLNAKSIMGLMSMALTFGTEIILSAKGPDEKEAVEKLKLLVNQDV